MVATERKTAREPVEQSTFERRYFSESEIRLKAPGSRTLAGYAAMFNKWSEDLGFFREKIAPGAFAKTIKTGDIRALINHDPNLIIGRTKNDTLRLWEDDEGLGYEVDLPETSYADDLLESIGRRDITGNSFGFQTIRDKWGSDGTRRTLIEVKLFDVSPVTFPAYAQTKVKVRLMSAGIDVDALSLTMLRNSRGATTESDRTLLRATIERLTACLAEPETEPEADKPGFVSSLIRMRATLDRAARFRGGTS